MKSVTTIENPRSRLPVMLLFLMMSIVGMLDLVLDAPDPLLSVHFVVDLSFVILCFGVAIYLYRGWIKTRNDLARVQRALAARQDERDAWREQSRRLREGLGATIDAQLRSWNLTRVERQTAFLLLKGFSHKEIARLTERSDRTVRQHAVDIYRKSGLAGRAELSAFFLEDMLLPLSDTDAGGNGHVRSLVMAKQADDRREAVWCPKGDGDGDGADLTPERSAL